MVTSKRQISKIYLLITLLLLLSVSLSAQKQPKEPPEGNLCRVILIDNEKMLGVMRKYEETGDEKEAEKLAKTAMTEFPEFETEFYEEKNNIYTYPFPESKYQIFANVFYTDESMASHGLSAGPPYNVISVKLYLGIVQAGVTDFENYKPRKGDIVFNTEITYDYYTNMIRMHAPVSVNDKEYTIGMHCDFLAKDRKHRIPNY